MTGTSLATDIGAGERVQMTRAGFERMQEELDTLRTVQRPDALRRLRRATLYVDPPLGEGMANSARDELDLLDQQIARLETVLQDAAVVDPPADLSRVQLGLPVTVRHQDGSEETLTVVGPREAAPARGRVSSGSPIGQTLLGKRVGDDATAGGGEAAVRLTVLKIEQPVKADAAPMDRG